MLGEREWMNRTRNQIIDRCYHKSQLSDICSRDTPTLTSQKSTCETSSLDSCIHIAACHRISPSPISHTVQYHTAHVRHMCTQHRLQHPAVHLPRSSPSQLMSLPAPFQRRLSTFQSCIFPFSRCRVTEISGSWDSGAGRGAAAECLGLRNMSLHFFCRLQFAFL